MLAAGVFLTFYKLELLMSKPSEMMVMPHLTFDGHAEEALNTYKKAFDVEVLYITRYGERMTVSPAHTDKILHAEVKLDGNLVMLADCFEGSKVQSHPLLGLFLNYTEYKKAESAYNILSEGGTIEKPYTKIAEGRYESKFRDKYGITWSIVCNEKESVTERTD